MARGAYDRRIGGLACRHEPLKERLVPAEVGRKSQRRRVDARKRGLEGADVGAGGDAAQGGREGDDAEELREAVVVFAGEEKKTG